MTALGPLRPFCNACGWRKGGPDSWDGIRCKCGHRTSFASLAALAHVHQAAAGRAEVLGDAVAAAFHTTRHAEYLTAAALTAAARTPTP